MPKSGHSDLILLLMLSVLTFDDYRFNGVVLDAEEAGHVKRELNAGVDVLGGLEKESDQSYS